MHRLVLLLVLLLVPSVAVADQSGRVTVQHAQVSGVTIDSTNSVAKDAAAAVTNTDALYLIPTDQHSIGVTVTATQSVSLTVTAQGSYDGTNFIGFTPAVQAAFTIDGTTTRAISALSLPVVPYVRFTLSSDATYPVTYTDVSIGKY